MTSEDQKEFHLYLFDSPRLEQNGDTIKLNTKKIFALLAYLLVTDSTHSRDHLATLLWPESSTESSRSLLRNALSILRKVIGDGFIVADRETVTLGEKSVVWVDTDEFAALLSDCDAHPHEEEDGCERCFPLAEQAIGLYSGSFLQDFSVGRSAEFDGWMLEISEALALRVHSGYRLVCNTLQKRGSFAESLVFGRRWLQLDEFNEEAHRELMRGYAESGDKPKAIRQFMHCKELLVSELEIEPDGHTVQLYHEIQKAASIETTALPARRLGNLPRQLSSFVGRDEEIVELTSIIYTGPLLTLTGHGGAGKTRLSIEVASRLAGSFPDGVWFTELAGLTDPELIPRTVATVFKIHRGQDIGDLVRSLSGRQALLVLDNCEHLIEACAEFASIILSECPELRLLATSREPLRISGEKVFPVPPLKLPIPEVTPHTAIEEVRSFEAVRLFIDRARSRIHDFDISAENASDVAEICSYLQGSPLAIEMAATRVNMLSPRELRNRIDSHLGFLKAQDRSASARHRDLQAVFDWSYDLLEVEEQELLINLSVFRGGFTLNAAEEICGGENKQTYDIISSLFEKSLVESLPESPNKRYRLLEPVRQCAAERLDADGYANALRDKFITWFLTLAEDAAGQLHGPAQIEWLDRLEEERFNHLEAIRQVLKKGDGETALRYCNALHRFWLARSYSAEGYSLICAALELRPDTQTTVRASAYLVAGRLADWNGYREKSKEYTQEGLHRFLDLGSDEGIAEAYFTLAEVTRYRDAKQTSKYIEISLGLWKKLGVKWGVAECLRFSAIMGLNHSGRVAYGGSLFLEKPTGDGYKEAAGMLREALEIMESIGNYLGVAVCRCVLIPISYILGAGLPAVRKESEELIDLSRKIRDWNLYGYAAALLGYIEQVDGNIDIAESHFQKGLEIHVRHSRESLGISNSLVPIARIHMLRGHLTSAALLFDVAVRLRTEGGTRTCPRHKKLQAELQNRMGIEGFDAALEKSEQISVFEAVHFAMTGEWKQKKT
ncbi:MAG: hypothetical protein HN368_07925 [Spirochaetales bacterium]|nr:hypothetical protein [Spirochaetales bacterium]